MSKVLIDRKKFLALVVTISGVGLANQACLQEAAPATDGTDASTSGTEDTGSADARLEVHDTSTSLDSGAFPPDTGPKDVGVDAGCSLAEYSVCNPRNNCGCALPQKCDWAWVDTAAHEGPSCRPVGSKGSGAPCLVSPDCDQDSTCFIDQCKKKTCAVDGDCGPGSQWRCVTVPGVSGTSVPGKVCAERCNLASPYACGFGSSGCVRNSIGGTEVTTCTQVGAKAAGEACTFATECKPGHFCPTWWTSVRCLRWCRFTASPSDCTAPETCKAFSDGALTVNGVSYGYCGP